MMMHKRTLIYFLSVIIFAIACNSEYTSKKKGYFDISLPNHTYQPFEKTDFPYDFEYPTYGKIAQDSTYFDVNPENKYWINVEFPDYNARLFLSYKKIGGNALYKIKQADGTYKDSMGVNQFQLLVNDAFNLTNKNDVIASSIMDSAMVTPNNINGVFFTVGGNAATAHQFFLTDTTNNFIRGALYFDASPNADSIRPVQEFLRKDIEHLINTFKWKNANFNAIPVKKI
jgi:gliding motility-associated lipoprotein GldD